MGSCVSVIFCSFSSLPSVAHARSLLRASLTPRSVAALPHSMDLPRLVYVSALQALTIIVGTSPTNGQEHHDVKVAPPEGSARGQFSRIAVNTILFHACAAYHLYYHSSEAIGIVENLVMFGYLWFFFLRMYCYWVLGRHFTFSLMIKENHQLVTSGPYQYLVHPSYTGQIGCIVMGLLFLRSYVVLAVMIPYAVYVLRSRILFEEAMMTKQFGNEYLRYVEARWRMVPKVW